MKIKLAILEKDTNYLNRFVTAFNTKYSDKFEIYSFTNLEIAVSALNESKIDVFIANDSFNIPFSEIPERCAFAYFADSVDIQSINDKEAISKFQKAELIYKQILNLYSENNAGLTGIHFDENESTKVLVFFAPAGGVGCSTAAAACASCFAKKNKKVLFLNLENYGSSDVFFSGEGNNDLSDVIYAIKSKKSNMALKLESTVKQDASGVYFYSSSKNALDVQELNGEEVKNMISQLKMFGSYDYIIVDMDFSLDKDTIDILKEVNEVVILSDGSSVANIKLERAIGALSIIEQQYECKIILKTGILYNRVSSRSSNKPNLLDIKEIGGIKRYEGYTIPQMVKELSSLNVFDSLM